MDTTSPAGRRSSPVLLQRCRFSARIRYGDSGGESAGWVGRDLSLARTGESAAVRDPVEVGMGAVDRAAPRLTCAEGVVASGWVATIRARICCELNFWWTARSEESGGSEEVSDSSAVGHAVDVDCEAGFHVDVTSRYLSGGAVTDVDSCCAGVIFDQGVVPVVVFAVSEKCLFRLFQVEAGCEAIAVFGEAFGELVGFLDIAADHEGTVGGEGGLPAVFCGTAQSCGEGRFDGVGVGDRSGSRGR